jgi:hypothetical protein
MLQSSFPRPKSVDLLKRVVAAARQRGIGSSKRVDHGITREARRQLWDRFLRAPGLA